MAVKTFDAKNLARIDRGALGEQLNMHIDKQVKDCKDRWFDRESRTVTLKITLTPNESATNAFNGLKANIDISSVSPKHKSQTIELGLNGDGKALFNEHFSESLAQVSLLDGDEDEDE